jgi:GTP-binding protein
VDHGKTTLIDRLLWLSGRGPGEAELDSSLRETEDRQKVIRLMPPAISLEWENAEYHFLDIPIRYGAGRPLDRVLEMADGVIYIVDAAEGPVPQTRLALHAVLQRQLPLFVLINRIDYKNAKPAEVLALIKDQIRDLEGDRHNAVPDPIYTNALRGLCRFSQTGKNRPLTDLLTRISEEIPLRHTEPMAAEQVLTFVSRLEYDPLHGRLPVGRIDQGTLHAGDRLRQLRQDKTSSIFDVSQILKRQGQHMVPVTEANAGEIVAVLGAEHPSPGELFCDPEMIDPPVARSEDEPTLEVRLEVSRSPLRESARTPEEETEALRKWLWSELVTNPSIQVATDDRQGFVLATRDELQLSMMLELLRREGFELWVDRPVMRTCVIDGETYEALEELELDLPQTAGEAIVDELASRGAENLITEDRGSGRILVLCHLAARGLLGFRADLLAHSHGQGSFAHRFAGWKAPPGVECYRRGGVLISDRDGDCTIEALGQLQSRGTLFVSPGEPVYRGMILGEHAQPEDAEVDPTKRSGQEHRHGQRARWLIPPRSWTIEQAFGFIGRDEQIELGSTTLRFRKQAPV